MNYFSSTVSIFLGNGIASLVLDKDTLVAGLFFILSGLLFIISGMLSKYDFPKRG